MKQSVIRIISVTVILGLISSKIKCCAENVTGSHNHNDICLSPGCVHAASNILNMIDPKVDPCNNFYQFACGKYLKSTVIPDDQEDVTEFSITNDKLEEKLRISLEEKSRPYEPKPLRLAKNLYKACMNKPLIEEKGLTPILNTLESLGGWPVLEKNKWEDRFFEWKKTTYELRRLGYSTDYFFTFITDTDLKKSSKQVIHIDQPFLGLDRDYLTQGFKDRFFDAYYKYMVDIAVILGADKARAKKELKESLEFEMKLAKISLPNEKRQNDAARYNPMTIKQLSKKYPTIPWEEYINTMLKPNVEVDDSEIVIVDVPSYFKDFEKLMKQTPKRIQANYAMWRVVSDSIAYLSDNIRKRQFQYSTEISGQAGQKPRWKECAGVVSEGLKVLVGALYVKKYFSKEAKKNVEELVLDIQQEFQRMITTLDWMDERTRKRALGKVQSMTKYIGYPDELLDDKELEKLYGKLEISKDDYFHSSLNLTLYDTDLSFSNLKKPVDKSIWIAYGDVAVANAFYNRVENSVHLPAGILQGVFFNNERPKYMNYGAIGQLIGHEIIHGFDDQGSQHDENGDMVDWWEPETRKKYSAKAQCIVNQYNNYTAEEVRLKVNGTTTEDENIADNGGVKISYLAYQKWVKQHGSEPKLPKLKYSPSQLFWISAANMWCAKTRPETLKQDMTTDFHSPAQFRVLGPLSNMQEFAKDFKCPVGSKMNPRKKCSVW